MRSDFAHLVRALLSPGACVEVTHADGRVEYMDLREYRRCDVRALRETYVRVIAQQPDRERASA